MKSLAELYNQEQELLKKYDQNQLVTNKKLDNAEILKHVGIDVDFGFLPQGYLNFYHQDFIVEEIDRNGKVRSIEPDNLKLDVPINSDQTTLFVDLVKTGMSTLEAVNSIAAELGVPLEKINYAGIKDKVAVTSQRISIEGASIEKIRNLKIDGLLLKNFSWGTGNIFKGALQGNRFIILVRTSSTLGQGWLKSTLAKSQDGFYNFYYLQRFGTPRLLSHLLGRTLLQQDFRQTIKLFMTDTGVQDILLLNDLRAQAAQNFGDWDKIEQIFLALPYTFRLELDLIKHLKQNSEDYLGALRVMPDQLTIWTYAYGSYLFNLNLSRLINEQAKIPKRLPLLLNPKFENVPTYVEQLQADNIKEMGTVLDTMFEGIKNRPQIRTQNTYATIAPVKILNARIIDKAVAIAFELKIGVYATTFLSHLFELNRGMPIPDWLDETKHDSKKILGLGTIEQVEEMLGEYMFEKVIDS